MPLPKAAARRPHLKAAAVVATAARHRRLTKTRKVKKPDRAAKNKDAARHPLAAVKAARTAAKAIDRHRPKAPRRRMETAPRRRPAAMLTASVHPRRTVPRVGRSALTVSPRKAKEQATVTASRSAAANSHANSDNKKRPDTCRDVFSCPAKTARRHQF